MKATYPQMLREQDISPESKKLFAHMNTFVPALRNIRAEMQMPPSEKTDLILIGKGAERKILEEHSSILLALTPTQTIEYASEEPALFGATAVVGSIKLFIPMPDSLKKKEKARLEKEQEKVQKLIESTQIKHSNEEFRSKAPAEVVQKLETALNQSRQQMREIDTKLAALK